jgi:hypothetical protein
MFKFDRPNERVEVVGTHDAVDAHQYERAVRISLHADTLGPPTPFALEQTHILGHGQSVIGDSREILFCDMNSRLNGVPE